MEKEKRMTYKETVKVIRDKESLLKKMPVDDLLDFVGFHCNTPNKLEEDSPVDNPELDKMIVDNHIKGVEV